MLDPVGTVSNKTRLITDRLDELEGVTIGLLDNTKTNADIFLEEVGNLLTEEYGVTTASRRKDARQCRPNRSVQLYRRNLTDGLPVVPSTEERVEEMLAGTSRDPREVIGVLPPRYGDATVEKIAINAVMVGCKPEYMPVLVAAVAAMCEDEFNLYGINAMTHPVAPLLIVNGPIVDEINLNYGYNVFGQGWRANGTIGHAIRLLLANVSGGVGKHSMALPSFGETRSVTKPIDRGE